MLEIGDWTRRVGICAIALLSACAADPSGLDDETRPIMSGAGGPAPTGAAFVADTELNPQSQRDAAIAASDATPPSAAGLADAGVGMNPDSAPADAAQPDAGPVKTDAGGSGPADASTAGRGGSSVDSGPLDPSTCAINSIPDALRGNYKLGAIYKRYADANGVPVVASEKPSDEAIRRACLLVLDYSSVRADVREVLLSRKVRFIMMAGTEKTVDFPEYAALGDLDARARGLGGVTDGICAEENVLCDRASDRWRGESICVHEYSHTMHQSAWNAAIPDFNTRLQAAFRAATTAGKYQDTYAGSKLSEYLAEGVQDWYNTNLQSAAPNGVHNHVNTRAELQEYDPTLYALLSEVLPDRPSFRDCYYYE